jgi:transposase
MIPSGVEIYVALEPIDMRLSFDRLAGLAKERVGYDARSGALFLFFGRRGDALKILFFDGSGMAIFYKRLDRGTFRIPERPTPTSQHVEIDEAALDALLDGVDVQDPRGRDKTH